MADAYKPGKCQKKRNKKNVFTLKGSKRWDTVRYRGKVGFVSGFTGTSACRIINIEGNYIKNPAKKYTQVNLREVRKIHENKSIVSQYANSSSTFVSLRKGTSWQES